MEGVRIVTTALLERMRVQTKGLDENYSFPHMKYKQLIFAVTVPFSTLITHAFTLFFFSAFSVHVSHTCTRHTRQYRRESSQNFLACADTRICLIN
jgi:hypothetical protein